MIEHRMTTTFPQFEMDYHTFESYWAITCSCGVYSTGNTKEDVVLAHHEHIR